MVKEDPVLGSYQELTVGTIGTVRYFTAADVFVFRRRVTRAVGEIAWPRFSMDSATDARWGAISWADGIMVGGATAASPRAYV